MFGRIRGPYTVKHRNATVGSPWSSVYTRVMCSWASFVTPYGLTGSVGWSSAYSSDCGFPDTDDELPRITLSTSASLAASNSVTVPPTLMSVTFRGSATLVRTPAWAAWWTTTSASATTARTVSASRTSPSRNVYEFVENFTTGYPLLDLTREAIGTRDSTYQLRLNVAPESFLSDDIS